MSGTFSLAAMTEGRAAVADESDDGSTQEVRLAVVMTGGASLAVWMGGVAREINLLTGASAHRDRAAGDGHVGVAGTGDQGLSAADAAAASRWAALLEILDVEVSVDVLAGASAGGINAALLGYANAHDADLGPLRDLWITLGSLRELMRRPGERSFPSLLRGDAVMLPALQTALRSLEPPSRSGHTAEARRARSARTVRPTSVFITTTILRGESARWSDDLGGIVRDLDHRGLFVFGEDDLTDPEAANRLALAARASAAFPGAFEPAYIPVQSSPDADHPDMADYVNAASGFYGSDGGILVNRPIGPALQEIFDRPAHGRQVRRVLAYVVPAPNPPDDPTPSRDDGSTPTVSDTLLGALGAALNQSIASDLRRIRDHNEAVRGVRASRRGLFRLAPAGGPRLADEAIYEAYRHREAERAADVVLSTLDRIVTDTNADTNIGADVGADAATLLADPAGRTDLRAAAVAAALAEFPDRLPGPDDLGDLWRLGRPAVDAAKGILISMINEAYLLSTGPDDRVALATLAREVHAAVVAPREQAGAQLLPLPSTPANRGGFTVVRHTLRDLAGASSAAVVAEATRRWLRGAGDEETSRTDLTLAWSTLGSVTENLRGLLTGVLARSAPSRTATTDRADRPGHGDGEHGGRHERDGQDEDRPFGPAALIAPGPRTHTNGLSLAGRRRVATRTLRDFVGYLPTRRSRAALALLDLHLVTHALTGGDVVDQPVELVQVSADIRCDLDPSRASADRKLTGLQLGNFGAFAKSSWRASDWMWGRLDGAAWLARILLDPRRLVHLRDAAAPGAEPPDSTATWLTEFVELLATVAAGPVTADVLDELAWLDDPDAAVPAALPETAAWVAAGIQREIAAGELTSVADAVRADIAGARVGSAPTREFLDAMAPGPAQLDPADAARVLRACRVSDERLTDRANSPILAITVAQVLAVLTGWLASLRALPRPLRPAVAAVRAIARVAYALVDDVTRGRRRATIALGTVLLAAGLAGALILSGPMGGVGLLVAVTGLLLISLTGWRVLPAGLAVVGVAGLAVVAAAGVIPVVGDHLFPWLHDDAVPYLADHPWAWAAVFGLLMLPPVWSLAELLRPRRRSRHRPAS
ncbi:patatin-like protein [Parafrankia sp. BMG5.11]|uniref:patatin-like protein n=2 Tax=unclassified Parafrankia TaxID=2994368 RepID=UPI000DA44FBB|nr:patatin-like protein [Parafrankia sp. BMG5.11]TCJ35433.1 patatin-like protein [Parafrankia sp. BMG5.11]SQD97558.1 Patatin [Parafrankia sp. Ea1.12]